MNNLVATPLGRSGYFSKKPSREFSTNYISEWSGWELLIIEVYAQARRDLLNTGTSDKAEELRQDAARFFELQNINSDDIRRCWSNV